jgi:translation elongation factor EF-1alpha
MTKECHLFYQTSRIKKRKRRKSKKEKKEKEKEKRNCVFRA